MNWEFVVALVIAIPIIAFPVLLWYLDIDDIFAANQKASKKRVAHRKEVRASNDK